MSLTDVAYDRIVTPSKTEPSMKDQDRPVVRQIDELQRLSKSVRDKQLGADFFDDIEDFYNLVDDQSSRPDFRPRISIPQLQTLVLNEATDLTDSAPKVYIAAKDQRDKDREKYFQANWRAGCYNNRILDGFLWSMLAHSGYLLVGFDPLARRGRGVTWVSNIHPRNSYPDPYAINEASESFHIVEEPMYLDQVKLRWPEKGKLVRPRASAASDPYGTRDGMLEFPEMSPLSQSGESAKRIMYDQRVVVRHCFLFDTARERIEEKSVPINVDLLVSPRFKFVYPNGRWITECEGVILADGENWCPKLPDDERGTFPIVRIQSMPAIKGWWGPPPVNFSRHLQAIAERLYTQFFENVVRINNGIIVIQNNSGLAADQIGWIPGEVLTINAGSQKPEVISPQPLPQHMISFPNQLLSFQKELQGFTPARQGEQSAGNVSPDLFDATVFQSQYMTRLRGRMLAESIQRLAQIVFYTDMRYKVAPDSFLEMERGEPQKVNWSPVSTMDDYDIYLDRGSLRVMSAAALRTMVSSLAKANMLPASYVLEAADIPGAEELAEQKMRELELASLAKLKRPR